ncbi:MAG: Dyp-type peroxidase [Burkholderiales bacterium]|nr:Dyp-type peroxidase [Burkholderiales bacterium]
MTPCQPGILEPIPAAGRYLPFHLAASAGTQAVRQALARLVPLADGRGVVVGIAPSVVQSLGAAIPGLHECPDFSRGALKIPVTPGGLWCWLRGDEPGDLLPATRAVQEALAPAFVPGHVVDGFCHHRSETGHGRDLTGYEDGTENPEGEAAEEAALAHGLGEGLDGGSYVAVQQWVHDFAAFEAKDARGRDFAIGRRLSDNAELEEAPQTAHVKRTAQESFDPEAFVVRRSMPWALSLQAGLMFVCFGKSFQAFEQQMRRMTGHEDRLVDALFDFSRPVNGAYYWCPPLRAGRLDLRRLGVTAA